MGFLPCFHPILIAWTKFRNIPKVPGSLLSPSQLYEQPKMRRLSSPVPLIPGHVNVSPVLGLVVATAAMALITIVRFVLGYIRARCEFPGPPVNNFWTGNLDQTMADNVHEKVGQSLRYITINLTGCSGCNGTVNMDTSFKPSVSSFE